MAKSANPLISCLMVTRGGLFPARLAIDCYRRQTWSNRELVVVCDVPDSAIGAHVKAIGDPTIRYVEVAPQPLGSLRNASVAAAKGELLAQWDDDDLYHPERLARQAAILTRPDAPPALFLQRWIMWWPARRLLGLSKKRMWEGSMLIRREVLPPYPPIAKDEDAEVRRQLLASHDIAVSDEPHLYCYIIHGANTWHESHFENLIGQSNLFADYEGELSRLAAFLPVREYEAQLGTRAKDWRSEEALLATTIRDRRFGNEVVMLDGYRFERCRFDGTSLVYGGGAAPHLQECEFRKVRLSLTGPAMQSFETLRFFTEAGVIAGFGQEPARRS